MLVVWKRESYIEILYKSSPGKWQRSVCKTPNERDKMLPTQIVGNMGTLNSVSIRIESKTYRALVDMRSEVSVISSRIYESFRPRLEHQKKDVKFW